MDSPWTGLTISVKGVKVFHRSKYLWPSMDSPWTGLTISVKGCKSIPSFKVSLADSPWTGLTIHRSKYLWPSMDSPCTGLTISVKVFSISVHPWTGLTLDIHEYKHFKKYFLAICGAICYISVKPWVMFTLLRNTRKMIRNVISCMKEINRQKRFLRTEQQGGGNYFYLTY